LLKGKEKLNRWLLIIALAFLSWWVQEFLPEETHIPAYIAAFVVGLIPAWQLYRNTFVASHVNGGCAESRRRRFAIDRK
jgi:hypothetical protein